MKPFLVLAVAAAVLFAGCSGFSLGGAATPTAEPADAPTSTAAPADPTSTATPDDDGDGGDATDPTPDPADPAPDGGPASPGYAGTGTYDPLGFEAGQTYRYAFTAPDGVNGTVEFEVLSATEDAVSVRWHVVTGNLNRERVTTSAPADLYDDLARTEVGDVVRLGADVPNGAIAGEALTVGSGYRDTGQGTLSYVVERYAAYGGVDCSVFVYRVAEEPLWESCVTTDSPLPVYTVHYADGDPEFEFRLLDADRQ
jgi:hypothetical protein